MSLDEPLVTQTYVCKAQGEDLVLQDITLPPMKVATNIPGATFWSGKQVGDSVL